MKKWIPALNGWKGFLAICILMLHFCGIYLGNNKYFATSYLAVDGFFIISGFFLFLSWIGKDTKDISFGKEVYKRIKKIYPVYLISIILLVLSYIVFPKMRSFSIVPEALIGEIAMLQMSGIFQSTIVNFTDWYVSAMLIAMIFFAVCYKLNKKATQYFLLPFCVFACYGICFTNQGNLDIHYHFKSFNFIYGRVLRAIGGIALGGLCAYVIERIQQGLDKQQSKFKFYVNSIELLSAICVFFLLIGRTPDNCDYLFPLSFSIAVITAYLGEGMISRILSNKVFQLLGDLSLEIFLTQSILIYYFLAFIEKTENNHFIITVLFIVIQLVFAYIAHRLLKKKITTNFITKLKIKSRNFDYVIISACLAVVAIYLIQGSNIWAETVAEYQKYAEGASIEGSFAGYLTIFPILMGYAYYYLLSWTPISWYTFCTVISCIYAVLSVVSILIVCKRKNISKVDTSCILLALLALVAHPSVSSLINITHLGYIPVVLYIVLSVFDGTITDGMDKLPTIALLPLLVAVISKPSFFCLAFLLVSIGTKTYKRPIILVSLLGSSILSAVQLLMFGGDNIGFKLGNLKGIVKFAISFVEATGASIYFPVRYYIEGAVSAGTILISLVLGIFVVGSLLWFLWKEKNDFKAWVRTVIIFSIIAACVMPYLTMDYTQGWQIVQQQVFNLSFWKHKLQYQLTSSIVMIAIFVQIIRVHIIQKQADEVIKQGVSICVVLALLNGVCCGLYSSHWQTVSVVKGKGVSYTNTQNFKYAPNPDWDWSWSEDMGGWTKGSQYYGYTKRPENIGGAFRDKNAEMLPEVNAENAKIYLMLSDPTMINKSAVDYWEFFYRSDRAYSYTFGEYTIEFSEATNNAVRYAVVPYTRELAEFLYSQNYTITKTNDANYTPLDATYLNFCIVW